MGQHEIAFLHPICNLSCTTEQLGVKRHMVQNKSIILTFFPHPISAAAQDITSQLAVRAQMERNESSSNRLEKHLVIVGTAMLSPNQNCQEHTVQ